MRGTRKEHILALLSFFAVALVAYWAVVPNTSALRTTGIFVSNNTISKDFDLVWDLIVENYVDEISNTDSAKLKCFRKTMHGGISHCLRDTHSRYYYKVSLGKTVPQQGEGAGVGLLIVKQGGEVTVLRVIEGTPAEKAEAFLPRDVIVEIDGKSVVGKSLNYTKNQIRGALDKSVSIRVRRKGTLLSPVTISRALYSRDAVMIRKLPENILLIKIRNFSTGTSRELWSELGEYIDARNPAPQSFVIIDLRNDLGGSLTEAVKITTLFAGDDDEIVSFRGKVPKEPYTAATGAVLQLLDNFFNPGNIGFREAFKNSRIVVLINQNSASASELMAGFLRDTRGALLVGTKSREKGSIQNKFLLGSGGSRGYLWLTTHEFFVGNGKLKIDGVGLVPDYPVPDSEDIFVIEGVDPENDLQLWMAIKVVLSGTEQK